MYKETFKDILKLRYFYSDQIVDSKIIKIEFL